MIRALPAFSQLSTVNRRPSPNGYGSSGRHGPSSNTLQNVGVHGRLSNTRHPGCAELGDIRHTLAVAATP